VDGDGPDFNCSGGSAGGAGYGGGKAAEVSCEGAQEGEGSPATGRADWTRWGPLRAHSRLSVSLSTGQGRRTSSGRRGWHWRGCAGLDGDGGRSAKCDARLGPVDPVLLGILLFLLSSCCYVFLFNCHRCFAPGRVLIDYQTSPAGPGPGLSFRARGWGAAGELAPYLQQSAHHQPKARPR
jgi:hypothetical protein